MLANLWRFLLALCDLRTLARLLTGRPAVDVVFITNLRDEAERRRFFGSLVPRLGHANGPRMHVGGVAARVRGIYVTAEEMLTKDGRRKARELFIAATAWAESQGARVILLAASTKRLFGRDGRELKERFPNLLFTIGDNGTAHMLREDVFRGLWHCGLRARQARILVIGPYGILGTRITQDLVEAGHQVVGYGSNAAALAEIAEIYQIPVATQIADIGPVDAVVACTHSASARLTAEQVRQLQRGDRRLLVIDVAEPANLDQNVHATCRDRVVRQDAGNAYNPALKYVLGALSWRKLMLSRGTVFGCFGEAMTLHHAIYRNGHSELGGHDWFVVDNHNMEAIGKAFADIGFIVPQPRSFGAPVHDFELEPPVQGRRGINIPKVVPAPGTE